MTRENVVKSARLWLGTPFHHQGRTNGVGVDCVGLVIGVGRSVGLLAYDFTRYSRQPNPEVLLSEVNAQLDHASKLGEGSVLLFNIVKEPQHFGIYTGAETNTVIHSYSGVGKVIEQDFDVIWRRRLIGIYDFKGLSWQA